MASVVKSEPWLSGPAAGVFVVPHTKAPVFSSHSTALSWNSHFRRLSHSDLIRIRKTIGLLIGDAQTTGIAENPEYLLDPSNSIQLGRHTGNFRLAINIQVGGYDVFYPTGMQT